MQLILGEKRSGNQDWRIQRNQQGTRRKQTKQKQKKTQHNVCWTALHENKHRQRKQDMVLLQIQKSKKKNVRDKNKQKQKQKKTQHNMC